MLRHRQNSGKLLSRQVSQLFSLLNNPKTNLHLLNAHLYHLNSTYFGITDTDLLLDDADFTSFRSVANACNDLARPDCDVETIYEFMRPILERTRNTHPAHSKNVTPAVSTSCPSVTPHEERVAPVLCSQTCAFDDKKAGIAAVHTTSVSSMDCPPRAVSNHCSPENSGTSTSRTVELSYNSARASPVQMIEMLLEELKRRVLQEPGFLSCNQLITTIFFFFEAGLMQARATPEEGFCQPQGRGKEEREERGKLVVCFHR